MSVSTTLGAALAHDIHGRVGDTHHWVLILVDQDGEAASVSSMSPRASGELVKVMAENWQPLAVDNIR